VAWLVVTAAACQCFVPVTEGGKDGGADSGLGGGVGGGFGGGVDGGGPGGGVGGGAGGGVGGGTGGGGTECTTASQCGALDAGFPFCSGTPSGSCISGRCVTECAGGRTCGGVENQPYCLICYDPVVTQCAPSTCSAIFSCTMTIGGSTCARGPQNGTRWRADRQTDCSWSVVDDAGVEVGHWFDLTTGEAFGTFAGVDGRCVGKDLFTGVPRMQWSCPDGCVFVEEGCD
jgi:hypothetical protein